MPALASAPNLKTRQTIWRWTLLTHRWIGIALGALVFLWCVSGIVMMYVPYPALQAEEQLAGLDPLELERCCDSVPDASRDWHIGGDFVVEMHQGHAVLRSQYVSTGDDDFGKQSVIDLETGTTRESWSLYDLQKIGAAYASARDWTAPVVSGWVDVDQWTVHSRFNAHRPMLHFADNAGNEWYVASSSGQIVQVTGAAERFWNWLGAVPHWLYFTALRQNTAAWAQTVIWLTVIGLFLTVTGLVIGIKQYRWRSTSQKSPYKAWMLWHHYAGLVFGLLTLTWLLSGLFSMNPWGALESRSFAAERAAINGVDQPLTDVYAALHRVNEHIPAGTVRIASAYWLDRPYLLAYDKSGAITRLSPSGVAKGVSESEARRAAEVMGFENADVTLLDEEDAYYYVLKSEAELPVYRIQAPNGERLYVSAQTGTLLRTFDKSGRAYRWLFDGLHRGDVAEIVRNRPTWDILMLLLLAGVSLGTGTGVYLGARYLMVGKRS